MLRRIPAALLIAYCIGLLVSLELLNDLPPTRHGFSTEHKTAVQIATYLPTALVVLFGIFWKRMVVDLKRIVPWSCLSRGWALGKESIELNYLDDLELSLIWPAARRHHWALLMALLGSILASGLVPLATSLTFIDLAGQVERQILLHHDKFDFNNTLLGSNSSLSLLTSFLGNTAWAGAANVLQSDGNAPAWTVDSIVFAPFHVPEMNHGNHTIKANTTAITAELVCENLLPKASVDVNPDGYAYINTNINIDTHSLVSVNLTGVDKSLGSTMQFIYKDPDTIIDAPVAWLNMSLDLNEGVTSNPWASAVYAIPIQLTLLQPIQDSGSRLYWNGTSNEGQEVLIPVRAYRSAAISCTPKFQSYSARIAVNSTTGVIKSYTLDNATASPIAIGIPNDAIIGYLNNPLHPDTIFGYADVGQVIDLQVARLGGALNTLPTFYTAYSGSDPFGTQLLDLNIRPVQSYFDDNSLLQLDAGRVFATTMTQIIKAFSITNGTRTSFGQVESAQPLLKIRQPILRILEACLVVTIITILCCIGPLRPKTCLSEDPGSLCFIARSLATNEALDAAFKIDDNGNSRTWRNSYFRLRQDVGPTMHIDMAAADVQFPASGERAESSYEPLQLRPALQGSLLLLLASYIIVLALLYRYGTRYGYSADSDVLRIAWSFVPTTVLVMVGYAVSGITAAVQAMAPLAILKTDRVSGRRVMAFSPRNRSELTLPYHASLKKAYLPVLLTSIIALAYPIVKIVAANLYQTFDSPQIRHCTAQLSPPVFDFQQLAQVDGGFESRLRNTAAIRTDWVQLPDLGVQSQPNVVRNLVFQNISVLDGIESNSGRLATIELTALAVNMTCDVFDHDAFKVSVFWDESFNLTFQLRCKTAECHDKIPYLLSDMNVPKVDLNSSIVAQRFENWLPYHDDPYGPARRFHGVAGNLFNSPTVQVLIADFGSISGPVSNSSFVPTNGSHVWVTPGMFNVSMPTARAVSCSPKLQNVRVNATLEKRVQPGLNGTVTTLPWAVTDFDTRSVKVIDDLNMTDAQVWRKMLPKGTVWGHSPFTNIDFTPVTTNWTNESILDGDEIRPESGIASSFFELLASYERSQGRESTALLDVDELASATIAAYGLYNAELLSHFRVGGPLSSRATQEGAAQAQLHVSEARVRPNPRTTFAVIGMLSGILVLLVVIFAFTRRRHGLIGKPGMIATQLSLFAGSKVVQRLREEDADSVWDEIFSLGWWRVEDPDQGNGEGLRWGIDIGKLDATLQKPEVAEKATKRCHFPFSKQ